MIQFRYDGRNFLDTAILTLFPGRPEKITTRATYSSEGLLYHGAREGERRCREGARGIRGVVSQDIDLSGSSSSQNHRL